MDADREIAQGADFEPSGDPVADRAAFMRDAARVVGHGTREYQKGLERSEEFEDDPDPRAEREASRVFGERMREIAQGYDGARAREVQADADLADDDHEIDAGFDDDHGRQLGMGIG